MAIGKGTCRLNELKLKRYHFDVTKGEMRDGIAFKYGCDTVVLPSKFACGETLNVAHYVDQKVAIHTSDTMISVIPLSTWVGDNVEIEPCRQILHIEVPLLITMLD